MGLVGIEGEVLTRAQMPTPSTSSEEVLWDSLLGLIEKVVQNGERYDVCGVGCGGPMTRNGALVSSFTANVGAYADGANATHSRSSLSSALA